MWNRWLTKTEPIGCHIGLGHLRLAQVQAPTSGLPQLVVAERELPGLPDTDPAYAAALADALRGALRSAPFRGTRVVSCLPPSCVQYRTMRLAPMPEGEMAQAAHWKAAAELGIKAESFKSALLKFGITREGAKQKTEALVLGAPVEHLDRHIKALVAAGLRPVAIDAPVCAVARCLGAAALAGAEAPAQQVVVELREDAAFLAIVAGTELAFVRPLGEGLGQFDRVLGDLLEIAPAEARVLHKAAAGGAGGAETFTEPASWDRALPFSRVREAIADASRVYGRELARQVALSTHYYATTLDQAAPEGGVVVSDRPVDPAAIEAVTVQSGIDFTWFAGTNAPLWTELKRSADAGAWVTAIGLSLYENGTSNHQEAA